MSLSYRLSPAIAGSMLSFRGRNERLTSMHIFVVALLYVTCMAVFPKAYWLYCFLVAAVVVALLALRLFRLQRKFGEDWGEISLSLREDGLEISHAGARILYFWPYIRNIRAMRAIENKENSWLAIIIGSAQSEVVPVPFSAFANDAERQTFVDAVKAGIVRVEQTRTEVFND